MIDTHHHLYYKLWTNSSLKFTNSSWSFTCSLYLFFIFPLELVLVYFNAWTSFNYHAVVGCKTRTNASAIHCQVTLYCLPSLTWVDSVICFGQCDAGSDSSRGLWSSWVTGRWRIPEAELSVSESVKHTGVWARPTQDRQSHKANSSFSRWMSK